MHWSLELYTLLVDHVYLKHSLETSTYNTGAARDPWSCGAAARARKVPLGHLKRHLIAP